MSSSSTSSYSLTLIPSAKKNTNQTLLNYGTVSASIERELMCLTLANCRHVKSTGKWIYQCQYMMDKRIENLISGADFQPHGLFYDQVIFDTSSGLQGRDIEVDDIFIQTGSFTSIIHEILQHHNVHIQKKYFETNTYSTTLKLGIRMQPPPKHNRSYNQNQSSVSLQDSTRSNYHNQTSRRNKVFIKFRQSLQYLITVIRKEREEQILINELMSQPSPSPPPQPAASSSSTQLCSLAGTTNIHSESSVSPLIDVIPKTESFLSSVSNAALHPQVDGRIEPICNEMLYELVLSLSQRIKELEEELVAMRALIMSIQVVPQSNRDSESAL